MVDVEDLIVRQEVDARLQSSALLHFSEVTRLLAHPANIGRGGGSLLPAEAVGEELVVADVGECLPRNAGRHGGVVNDDGVRGDGLLLLLGLPVDDDSGLGEPVDLGLRLWFLGLQLRLRPTAGEDHQTYEQNEHGSAHDLLLLEPGCSSR